MALKGKGVEKHNRNLDLMGHLGQSKKICLFCFDSKSDGKLLESLSTLIY